MTEPKNINDLLTEWADAKRNADAWTVREKALRNEIFTLAFPTPIPGTNKVRIDFGMALIGDYRINYQIDKAAMEASRGFIPGEVFDSVINFRPEVRDGAWRKLSDENKKLFGPFITEKPGTPGLEVKPQNKVRW